MEVDLKAYRCPNAQIMANAALQRFIASGALSMKLRSIEPSLERSLRARIEHLGLPLELSPDVVNTPISQEQREVWLSDFDEEDFEDVNISLTFVLVRR
jgi:hypothetical protein